MVNFCTLSQTNCDDTYTSETVDMELLAICHSSESYPRIYQDLPDSKQVSSQHKGCQPWLLQTIDFHSEINAHMKAHNWCTCQKI